MAGAEVHILHGECVEDLTVIVRLSRNVNVTTKTLRGITVVIHDVTHRHGHTADQGTAVVVVQGAFRIICIRSGGTILVIVRILIPFSGDQGFHIRTFLHRFRVEGEIFIVVPFRLLCNGSLRILNQKGNLIREFLTIEIRAGTGLVIAFHRIGQHGRGQFSGGNDDEALVPDLETVEKRIASFVILCVGQRELEVLGLHGTHTLRQEVPGNLHSVGYGYNIRGVSHEDQRH